ncbi:MAG: DUF4446 family protein [Lachnospiraceae bacterium]|jgi:hypothetical protein|nr:DUF4446 family protein [Lachnospiraceae bacterium]
MKEFLLQNIEYVCYVGIGAGIFIIALFILVIITLVKIKKVNQRFKNFMRGKDAESLEEVIVKYLDKIDKLEEENNERKKQINNITENLLITYQKIGIVKYDAFNEMGGKLSFSLALLDKQNNGFILNAMHSREGCYTYVKEIIDGNSYIALGEEEKKALDMALNCKTEKY